MCALLVFGIFFLIKVFGNFLFENFKATRSVPISKQSFDFIFTSQCKLLFKLLDAFFIFFLKHIRNKYY